LNIRETLKHIWRTLEKGFTQYTYTELYTVGAITHREYLEHMKRIEDEYNRNKTKNR